MSASWIRILDRSRQSLVDAELLEGLVPADLDVVEAEWFYRDVCQVVPLGQDTEKEGLMYFELSREQASRLLQREYE